MISKRQGALCTSDCLVWLISRNQNPLYPHAEAYSSSVPSVTHTPALKTRKHTHTYSYDFRQVTLFAWSFRFVCLCVRECVYACVSQLVGLSKVVYCTAALPTDGHYHSVTESTQGREFFSFSEARPHPCKTDIWALPNIRNEKL